MASYARINVDQFRALAKAVGVDLGGKHDPDEEAGVDLDSAPIEEWFDAYCMHLCFMDGLIRGLRVDTDKYWSGQVQEEDPDG